MIGQIVALFVSAQRRTIGGLHGSQARERIDQLDIPLLGIIPSDDNLITMEFSGEPLIELSDDSEMYVRVSDMMAKIL
jgi:CO dehydrogenase nickel-insertion accessory protein CooC1